MRYQNPISIEGGCRCGVVRLRITAAPVVTTACHCTGCRRMTASAFSCSAMIAEDGFEILEGKPVIGGLHGEAQHYFCPHCMSWLYTKMPMMAGFVNLRATMLDDVGWYAPFIETYTSEKLPWARTGAKYGFEKFPPMEKFGELMAEYAAQAELPGDSATDRE
jgi:hypothetical protein